MITYLIDEDLLKSVTDYLMTRPWKEVAGAMPKLLALKQHAELPEDKTDDR